MNSKTTERFRKAYVELPEQARRRARQAYRLFRNNPHHPSLQFKQVHASEPISSLPTWTMNEAAVQEIVEGDQDAFVRWCNDHESNVHPITAISIVERTRDRIREDFGLSEAELFPSRSAP